MSENRSRAQVVDEVQRLGKWFHFEDHRLGDAVS